MSVDSSSSSAQRKLAASGATDKHGELTVLGFDIQLANDLDGAEGSRRSSIVTPAMRLLRF